MLYLGGGGDSKRFTAVWLQTVLSTQSPGHHCHIMKDLYIYTNTNKYKYKYKYKQTNTYKYKYRFKLFHQTSRRVMIAILWNAYTNTNTNTNTYVS